MNSRAREVKVRLKFSTVINLFKPFVVVSKGFGSTQQHNPTRIKTIVKKCHQFFCNSGSMYISILRQVRMSRPGEGRVLDHILRSKDHHFTNHGIHAIAFSINGKKPAKTIRRYIGSNV